MTKHVSHLFFASVLVGFSALILTSTAAESRAETILLYQDTFTRGTEGALRNSTPTYRVGEAGASASAIWSGTITNGWGIDTSKAYLNVAGRVANGFLPFTPQAGYIYTLSADVYMSADLYEPVGENNRHLAFGFPTSNPTTTGLPDVTPLFLQIQLQNDGYIIGAGVTTANWSPTLGWSSVELGLGTHNLSLVLDTTEANWKASFFVDGTPLYENNTHTFAVNPTTNFVAFGTGNSAQRTTVDNFTLTASTGVIPEPGTFALLAAGLVGLLCYAWRRRK